MKKKLGAVLLVVALAIALVVPAAPAGAHMEGCPHVVTLYAGQTIDVGDVEVWNDGDNLYVTYVITEPDWVITETHLYVGQNIPGTTAPGQFPYDDDDATSVTDTMVDYVIPLASIDSYSMQLNKKGNETGKMVADDGVGVEPCENIFIAAHAVVNMIEEGYTVTDCLVSGLGTDSVLYLVEGSSGYPLGYTGPYQTYPGTPIPSVLAFVHGSWPALGVAGAQWIGSSYYTENTDNNTWRLFTRSFTFPTNATNISGTLTMNCDNAQEVYLNGTFVGLDTYAPATKIYGMPLPGSGTAHGWSSVESWDVSSILVAGNNDLWTMTRNYAWSGGPTRNPGGLIYGLCYEYDIPDTVIATETAWGDGTDFDHPNWAMYFDYHVQFPIEVESTGGATAALCSDEEAKSGDYSVKLTTPSEDTHDDMAAVYMYVDIALEDIYELSFWKMVTAISANGWNPNVILGIDANDDGDLDFSIADAMEWHDTHVGTLLGDDAFVECECPTGLGTTVDTVWVQLDAYNHPDMKCWGADSTGNVYPTAGYAALSATNGFQDTSGGVIDPTDKVLMVAIVIGGSTNWQGETAYIDDIIINGNTYGCP